jgi:N utilization substance protein B
VKALMALYAFNRRDDNDLPRAETELMFSIGKTRDLYYFILLLVVEIADIAREKIEQAFDKKIPTAEDLNPNRRFAGNMVIEQLRNNLNFNKYIRDTGLSWVNYKHIPRLLYKKMITWNDYSEYMTSEETGYNADKKFFMHLVPGLVAKSDDLLNCLEEQSIYWNDDIEYVVMMIDKTIRKFKKDTGEKCPMMPLFTNADDENFVRLLFRKAILNTKICSELIENSTTNWELERIALTDIIVMKMAITEILEFPEIPVKVTLNEYIEIAKYYCTSKSSTFVNGILDNIVKVIRERGMLDKKGRGLVDA